MPDASELLALPDGRSVQLWDGGDPHGRAVLFFHGCPDSRHVAFSGADAARRHGVRLVAVNRPGYGRSDAAASTHSSVADDTVAVADLLDIGRFAVLGMSIGGPYALAVAARYPGRVTAAALVSAPGMTVEMDPPTARDDLSSAQAAFFARLTHGSVADGMELMRPDFAAYVATLDPTDPDDEALARRFRADLPPEDAALLAVVSDTAVAASAREALLQHEGYLRDAALTFRAWDFRPERVAVSTTVWCGDLDRNHPVRNSRWLAEHVPTSTLTVLPDTGHLGALLNNWDRLMAALG